VEENARLQVQITSHASEISQAKEMNAKQAKQLAEVMARHDQYKNGVDNIIVLADKLKLCRSQETSGTTSKT